MLLFRTCNSPEYFSLKPCYGIWDSYRGRMLMHSRVCMLNYSKPHTHTVSAFFRPKLSSRYRSLREEALYPCLCHTGIPQTLKELVSLWYKIHQMDPTWYCNIKKKKEKSIFTNFVCFYLVGFLNNNPLDPDFLMF